MKYLLWVAIVTAVTLWSGQKLASAVESMQAERTGQLEELIDSL